MSPQFFSTTEGVAKREGNALRLLDVPENGLSEALCSNDLDSLLKAKELGAIELQDAKFRPPLMPQRIILIGANYACHVEEMGIPLPTDVKHGPPMPAEDTVIASGDKIIAPFQYPKMVDYESEVALIIGKDGSNISKADAWDHVSGITAINDVTARDYQVEIMKRSFGIESGDGSNVPKDFKLSADDIKPKMMPTFKPLGPGVLRPEDVRRDGAQLRAVVNGETRQDANFRDVMFDVPEMIEQISAEFPLKAGDVVMTGSPSGVGFFMNKFLKDRDVVEVFLGDLPPLRNTFQASYQLP